MNAPMPKVLVVEDEPAIAELIAVNLRHQGMVPLMAEDTQRAQALLEVERPDVLLLDWMLPGESGVAWCKRLRGMEAWAELPVVLLTARASENDKIMGLDAGADDYVTKPFSPQELLARLRAQLRRRPASRTQGAMQLGRIRLDESAHRAYVDDQEVKLGPTEFKLMLIFAKHASRVLTREQLLRRLWGDPYQVEERTVDVQVKRLREALGDAGALIQTVRGAGYRFEP